MKKALGNTSKYENVSDNGANLNVEHLELEEWMHMSRLVGSTNKIDFMRKIFSIHQFSSMPFW